MNNLLFISVPGGLEWFVILLVALLLFGKRLPGVARSMGKSITEFKRGLRNISDEINREDIDEVLAEEEKLEKNKADQQKLE